MDDRLIEPLKYYEDQGRSEHESNVKDYFNSLIESSGVNIEENRATMERWKEEQAEIADVSKKISKFKLFKALICIGSVIGAILAIVGISQFGSSVGVGILLLILGVGAVVSAVLALVKKINPVLKDMDKILQEHKKAAGELEEQGWQQMSALNSLFTDEDAVRLVEKTLPGFAFEGKFSKEQERLFVDKYDFFDIQDDECSMLDTLSGKYEGNPFLFARRRVHKMGSHTYTGSLHISWTETYRDSNGQLRTRTKSQVLRASVTKPKPNYRINTALIYGNQSAPDLDFSRGSSHVENLSEKALERKIRRGEHKLQKQAEKSLKNGGGFQEMANSEFDVLFGATDRNNEVEFRYMYTPVGQRNTVALLKDSKNFGDDFSFMKRGKCNVIISDHAQNWKMSVFARDYKHFDYDVIEDKFVNLNTKFFKSIFFDFAPLFSVPAYLDEPSVALEGEQSYDNNYTYYEHEVLANSMDYKSFEHESSRTEAILKTETIGSQDGCDLVAVTAYSYTTVDRVDLIPVKGGDGNYHNVPVPWIEYIPVSKVSHIRLGENDSVADENAVRYHGIGATFINN